VWRGRGGVCRRKAKRRKDKDDQIKEETIKVEGNK
jgi:hypothetical protein